MALRTPGLARSTRRLVGLLSLAVLLAAGHGCKQEQAAPIPEKPLVLDALPVPADLVANVYIPNPDVAWSKARVAVGGPAKFLPATTGSLAATLFGLPLIVGSEIDGNVPIVGAVFEGRDGGKPRAAIGLHLRAADKFIHQITKGENARHTARIDEKTKFTIIEPTGGGTGSAAIGVLGNYLVAAPTIDELLDVGPYVVRNLTTVKMSTNDMTFDLPRAALEGPVAKTIRSKWDSIKPRPRADSPATTLPSPVQSLVDGVLAVMGEIDHAKMTVDFDEQAARVRFAGTPKMPLAAGSRIASMTVGDPKKLLDLPGKTDVAVYIHDAPDVRANDAKDYAKALASAIGKDVTDEDRAAIEKALLALAKSRGDSFSAGFSLLPTGPAAFVRSSVTNRDDLGRAIDDLLGLADRKPVARWLGDLSLGVSTSKTVIEDVKGDVRRIRIERLEPKSASDKPVAKPGAKPAEPSKKEDPAAKKPPAATETPTSIDVLYLFGTENLVLGAGYDAKAALRLVLDASPKDNLSTRPEVATPVNGLGGKAAFVAVADLLGILARQSGSASPNVGAPLVFALGKGGDNLGADDPWMRLDVANAVLQEIIKRRGAF